MISTVYTARPFDSLEGCADTTGRNLVITARDAIPIAFILKALEFLAHQANIGYVMKTCCRIYLPKVLSNLVSNQTVVAFSRLNQAPSFPRAVGVYFSHFKYKSGSATAV